GPPLVPDHPPPAVARASPADEPLLPRDAFRPFVGQRARPRAGHRGHHGCADILVELAHKVVYVQPDRVGEGIDGVLDSHVAIIALLRQSRYRNETGKDTLLRRIA